MRLDPQNSKKLIRRHNTKFKARWIILVVLGFLVAFEVLFLKPGELEDQDNKMGRTVFKDLSHFVANQKKNDEVRYTMEGFHYTAVEGEVKQWEMEADSAVLFEVSKKVEAKNARIKMFDSTGKITFIEGDQANYVTGQKNFELEHNVKVKFPDGFWLKTDKALYTSDNQLISSSSDFYAESKKTKSEYLQIWGRGFTASKVDPFVYVLSNTKAIIHHLEKGEKNEIRSDYGKIDRFNKIAYFSMNRREKFVESDLGTLYVKSRRQEGYYDSEGHGLKYMTALDDVYMKETDIVKEKEGLKYATCQRADFVAKDDKIIMTGFPSAYQAHDTLTGELITVYRSKNLIEVTQANGLHQGN